VSEFYRLGTLINNQPQFNLEFGRICRTGWADGFTLTARYEGIHQRTAPAHARGQRGAAGDENISGACLRGYLAQPGVRSSWTGGPLLRRGSIGPPFHPIRHAARRLGSLSQPGSWDLTGSAGYGRYVTFSKTEETG
jgi:hypothetical protein